MIISDLHYLESVDTNVVGGSSKHYSLELEDYFDYLEKYFPDLRDYLQTYKDTDSKYKVYAKGNYVKAQGKGKGVKIKAYSFASPYHSDSHYSVEWM
jgi:hypothetical protein